MDDATIDISGPVSNVVATGFTPQGLRVDLLPYDESLDVAAPSEYDQWPEGPREMPPELNRLHIDLTDATGLTAIAGTVSWHLVMYGPNRGSHAWNIGIGLSLATRGHGVGAVAQRILAEWLLRTTDLFRIEASTDVTNISEQRSLERAGFTREGLLRSSQERLDGRHDLYSYSFLRSDLEAAD